MIFSQALSAASGTTRRRTAGRETVATGASPSRFRNGTPAASCTPAPTPSARQRLRHSSTSRCRRSRPRRAIGSSNQTAAAIAPRRAARPAAGRPTAAAPATTRPATAAAPPPPPGRGRATSPWCRAVPRRRCSCPRRASPVPRHRAGLPAARRRAVRAVVGRAPTTWSPPRARRRDWPGSRATRRPNRHVAANAAWNHGHSTK